ncbi:MAG: cyclic pyranopterin monophosphate synthase MoaC [Promethearchaeota archaeon]
MGEEMERVRMVEITQKKDVTRTAKASGHIKLRPETVKKIRMREIEKGNVLAVAKTAGILAAKQTPIIVPLCHPIAITKVSIEVEMEDGGVTVTSEVVSLGKTGVEMEALTALSAALLTIWDMVKKYEKDDFGQYPDTAITDIRIIKKEKKNRRD